jgi:hypothetical protein
MKPETPCRVCDLPQAGHGRRYTAGYGEHDWMAPRITPGVHELGRQCTEADPCVYCKPTGAGDRLFYGRTTA